MTGRDCKHCNVIKTLSGEKWVCKKTGLKCHCRKRISCGFGSFEPTYEAKQRWKIKVAEYKLNKEE